MKIRFTIILLTFISLTAVGQVKVLTNDSDTVFWFKEFKAIRNHIGLEPTEKIDSKFYFRFWDGTKAIELKQVNDQLIGTVTLFLQQYKKRKEGRLYFKKIILSERTTNTIYELVMRYKLIDLPTDNQINGWDSGKDGITYIIEYANEKNYSFKNYWTPTSLKEKIPEAKQLVDFIDNLNQIEELKAIKNKFMDHQPFTYWYTFIGSARITFKPTN
ncbi:MAG TPA: hypothetical protein VK172_11990 [Lentimicrobium sp.]|nr:hypothetical protein [Lentimicrobium sp.]